MALFEKCVHVGVGKSTNLSKICFWLLQNNIKILIAACDTFRSGAVEQLGVHVKNLKQLNESAKIDLVSITRMHFIKLHSHITFSLSEAMERMLLPFPKKQLPMQKPTSTMLF